MMGMIRDNGLVSEFNRGTFYGCRNSEGRLEGVALIGHATLVEARTRGAIRELALAAQIHDRLHMFMAEQEVAEEFWNSYADDGQPMRFACRELLFELKNSSGSAECKWKICGSQRLTTSRSSLRSTRLWRKRKVVSIHLKLTEGAFLARCARRIGQKRVWVVIKDRPTHLQSRHPGRNARNGLPRGDLRRP